ncbi:MAG: murein hydrolase activator EnvC [Saprospiraceae bacterium]
MPTTKNITKFLFILIIGCVFHSSSTAQSRQELENKRKDLVTAIKNTNRELSDTRQNKAKTLERFLALQKQIEQRKELIVTITSEIELSDQNITRNKDVVASLHSDLEQLKTEYAEMARVALRQKMQRNDLAFLFSASGFNNFFQRWRYLQQYDEYRQRQAGLIAETQEMLQGKIIELEQERAEKADILAEQEAQQQQVNEELQVKDRLLKSLKKVESKLAKSLAVQQRNRQKLNSEIEDVIRREIAERKRRARRPPTNSSSTKKDSPLAALNGQSFAAFQGKLDAPVANGTIVRRFGKQPHPTAKNLTITNNGIDIQAAANAPVKSVFAGKVVGQKFVPSYKNMVIIQHRNFYTVYSNLEEVFVQREETVKRGQTIGKIDGVKREVHFEVWRGKQRLNPANWIK